VVLTDHGSNILSELFQNTCKLLWIKRIHITAFHLNLTVGSRGVTGPFLVEYLRHYDTEDQETRMTG
jgi:hypothetical protein